MKLLKRVVDTYSSQALNFSIGAARRASWASAVILSELNDEKKAQYIDGMDKSVLRIAKRIAHPSFFSRVLLWVIRKTEYDDVRRTIHLINSTVVEK